MDYQFRLPETERRRLRELALAREVLEPDLLQKMCSSFLEIELKAEDANRLDLCLEIIRDATGRPINRSDFVAYSVQLIATICPRAIRRLDYILRKYGPAAPGDTEAMYPMLTAWFSLPEIDDGIAQEETSRAE